MSAAARGAGGIFLRRASCVLCDADRARWHRMQADMDDMCAPPREVVYGGGGKRDRAVHAALAASISDIAAYRARRQ